MSPLKRYAGKAAALLLAIMLLATSAFAEGADRTLKSNRFTLTEPAFVKQENYLSTEGFNLMMENDIMQFWFREQTAAVRVLDKRSGYIWGGVSSDKPDNMNSTWASMGNSIAAISYYDKTGNEKSMGIGHSDAKVSMKKSGSKLLFDVNIEPLSISFTFEMEMSSDSLVFTFSHNSLKEDGDYTISSLYFLPFLGTTQGNEIPGYMFVPDGNGALIRFSSISSYLKGFEKRVYGSDFGIESTEVLNNLRSIRLNEFLTDEPTVLMPVFGMVHGTKQHAFFAQIKSGEEYASIMATPSGVTTDYNWVAAKFILRQKYQLPTEKSGSGIQVVQKTRNPVEAKLEFKLLTGDKADYVGMALLYQQELIELGVLKQRKQSGDIPLKLDFICADRESGFIFDSTKKITSLPFVKESVNDIMSGGITNLNVALLGWQNGGLSGSKPKEVKLNPQTGKKSDITAIADLLKGKGVFSLAFDPLMAKDGQLDIRREGTITVSQSPISVWKYNHNLFKMDSYFLKPALTVEIIDKAGKLSEDEGLGLMLSSVGDRLYSNHYKSEINVRSDVKEMYKNSISNTNAQYLGISAPNAFMWEYIDGFYNAPMSNGQYMYETDTVPFLQIVLKGYVDIFAPYSNVDFHTATDILKHIDYGTYPAFVMTQLKNHEIFKTTVTDYNSTCFEDWENRIKDAYNKINSVLSKVEGATIINRDIPRSGLTVVSYSNGKDIYVNYTESQVTHAGVTIPALSAAVKDRR